MTTSKRTHVLGPIHLNYARHIESGNVVFLYSEHDHENLPLPINQYAFMRIPYNESPSDFEGGVVWESSDEYMLRLSRHHERMHIAAEAHEFSISTKAMRDAYALKPLRDRYRIACSTSGVCDAKQA